jgi:2-polyprenyl-3-methyl-5-hydroxy-6-metoxy-1,4-benzoquinol methylase
VIPAELQGSLLPLIETEPVPNCPVCGHHINTLFASGFDYEMKTCRNQWTFVKCSGCGHVWLNPRPAISTLPIIYPKNYYAYTYQSEINPIAIRAKEILDSVKMRAILRELPNAPASYLDVGCGDGRFLKVMEKQGVARARNFGLELDAAIVRRLADQGYRVFCERVEDCKSIPENAVDLITMFHVIEHVDDPNSVVRQLSNWLSPDGVLALETPNIDSLDARTFQKTFWGGYHIPRHWNLFNADTLARLLCANGLRIIGTQFQTGHAFWMYSFHHALRYGDSPKVALSKLFDPFKSIVPLAMFTGFDKLRAALGQQTSAMLMLARKA